MTLEQERAELKNKFRDYISSFSEPPPLDMEILEKRVVNVEGLCYEEWRITYTSEIEETAKLEAEREVTAYLLVPNRFYDEVFKPPFAAAICNHQCNVDCTLAKDAVVGKALEKPDQAYGYDLVSMGFVVLAPDAINCGERNIPALRMLGEDKNCNGIIHQHLTRESSHKKIWDGLRSVDLLHSLDFVDPEKIAVVGHSMGSAWSLIAMANDKRIKAGILSGLKPHLLRDCLPVISPRLVIGMEGLLYKTPEQMDEIETALVPGRRFYEHDGAQENLVIKTYMCGHYFHRDFKQKAFGKLRSYFGKAPRKRISLTELLKTTREKFIWINAEFPEIQADSPCFVDANEHQLAGSFATLFVHLSGKAPKPTLDVTVHQSSDTFDVVCKISCEAPETQDQAPASRPIAMQGFADHGAMLKREYGTDEIRYIVTLPKA